jgi:hypothetical protein
VGDARGQMPLPLYFFYLRIVCFFGYCVKEGLINKIEILSKQIIGGIKINNERLGFNGTQNRGI